MVAKSNTARLTRAESERAVKTKAQPAPAELDRLIHERVRLAIVSALAVRDRLTFNALKALLKTSDRHLSLHARKLEDAEDVACVKSFEGRVPKTEYPLPAQGPRPLD